jgi:hypothetical protein
MRPSRTVLPLFLAVLLFGPALLASAADLLAYQKHPAASAVWSDPAVAATAQGAQPFHGPFRIQTATLSLKHLPPHRWLKISFDLLILGSWDGSSRVWGPDLWSLVVRGGPRLVFASFSNAGIYGNNDEQSYPDDYPVAVHPAWTGAVKRFAPRQLFAAPLAPTPAIYPDSLYHLEVWCPHQDADALLDFSGIYDDPEAEQCWGLANVTVTVATADPTPPDALPALWDALGDPDPVRANAALWPFIGAGASALDFISARVPTLAGQVHDLLQTHDNAALSALGLRLHRLHNIARIVGGHDAPGICTALEHIFPEYYGILPENSTSVSPMAAPPAAPSP